MSSDFCILFALRFLSVVGFFIYVCISLVLTSLVYLVSLVCRCFVISVCIAFVASDCSSFKFVRPFVRPLVISVFLSLSLSRSLSLSLSLPLSLYLSRWLVRYFLRVGIWLVRYVSMRFVR